MTAEASDLSQETDELDALLARSDPLDAEACARAARLALQIPGRLRAVAHKLGQQRSAVAVDALLTLPTRTPGVVEGLYQAVRAGVTRRFTGDDGVRAAPGVLALEFSRSRARSFPELLRRCQLAFGEQLERMEQAGVARYRITLWARPLASDDGLARYRIDAPARGPDPRAAGEAFTWLHGRLSRLRGTRLWVNGWALPHTLRRDGITPAIQAHLVHAWLEWARGPAIVAAAQASDEQEERR
ncbi:MAG: hypothetical protein KC636_32015 [Myxococcales bacterium]|nr:hypothetical protein [Myxococcales bacterium]